MACSTWTTAISARVDGEDPGVDEKLLDRHLRHCIPCQTLLASLERLRRETLVAEAPTMRDLSQQVTRRNVLADRASRWGVVRALLTVVALEVVVFSLPALVLGDDPSATAHAARHLGAFSFAYGVALLVVVARPARARAMLPVTMVLAGALLVTAVVDVFEGRVPLLGETLHLPEMLSVLLVWLLARPVPARATADRRPGASPRLRVLEPHTDEREDG